MTIRKKVGLKALIAALVIFGGLIAITWISDHPFEIYQRKPIPPMRLQTVQGVAFSTDQWQPPYIINFFASWCVPCVAELPQLRRLSKELPVYGIAWNDSPEDLTAWLEKHQPPFTDVAMDLNGELYRTLMVGGVPITIVVDARYQIVHYHEGAVREEDINAFMRPIFDSR